MEKNLVKKLENYIKPRLAKIIELGNSDRQTNVLSNIIKTVTGEEEGTKEFFEYYDYSMNKVLYPDADMDVLNEAVEITLQDPDQYIDLGNDANPDLNEAEEEKKTGVKKRSGVGKVIDKGVAMATSKLGDNRFKRRNRLRKDTNAAEKANKKLDKAKAKGKSEKKIAKLQTKAKSKNMRKTASTIAVKSDEVKKAKKTNESETPLLEKCLNESFQWKENYGESLVTSLNDKIANDDMLYNEPDYENLFERINDYVSSTLNIDSMSDECMGITHEIIEEYDLAEESELDGDMSYLDELGDLSWVDEEA